MRGKRAKWLRKRANVAIGLEQRTYMDINHPPKTVVTDQTGFDGKPVKHTVQPKTTMLEHKCIRSIYQKLKSRYKDRHST